MNPAKMARHPHREAVDEWSDDALCRDLDPEIFFPQSIHDIPYAKAVCRKCPVRSTCLSHALRNDERWGVWGGLSEEERRLLQRSMR